MSLLASLLLPGLAVVPPAHAAPGREATHLTARPSRFVPVPLAAVEARAPARAATTGVATFNVLKYRAAAKVRRDMLRLSRRRGVDVIGWQEAEGRRSVFARMRARGWQTMRFRGPAAELPVSWRTRQFTLVSAAQHRMHRGRDRVTYPFPARYVTRVTLRHRATGRTMTVLNTHVNHRTTQRRHPGRWRRSVNAALARRHLAQLGRMWLASPGRYVVGTGDFNIDYRADRRRRPRGGPARVFRGRAVANWAALGTRGVPRTLRSRSGRRLYDTVYASHRSVANGWLSFTGQRVLRGYRSDHLPVVVRFRLR